MAAPGSTQRHADVSVKSCTRTNAPIPAFNIWQRGPIEFFLDTVPAARVSAEHQIGQREVIGLKKFAALQLPVDNVPQASQSARVGLEAAMSRWAAGVRTQPQKTGLSAGCKVESVQSSQRSTLARCLGSAGYSASPCPYSMAR